MKKANEVVGKVDTLALKQSFIEACSDDGFKKYLKIINIEEDILIKYTSTLKDSYEQFKHCQNCKNLDTCENETRGYLIKPEKKGNLITFSYIACSKKRKELEESAYTKNLSFYNIPQELQKATFKDVYKDKTRMPVIKFFKEFMEDYKEGTKTKGLYLNGSFGSGKTYLIAALFNEMAKKKTRCSLVYYPELLRDLKASFNDSYSEKFSIIMKSPLLLLDDVGAENCSNWSRDEVLGPILQYRMDNHLPTFFTSNLTIEELEVNLSVTNNGIDKVKARRIVERIKQLTIPLELVSKNRRG